MGFEELTEWLKDVEKRLTELKNRIGDVSTEDTLNYLIKDLNENRIGDVNTENTLIERVNELVNRMGAEGDPTSVIGKLKLVLDKLGDEATEHTVIKELEDVTNSLENTLAPKLDTLSDKLGDELTEHTVIKELEDVTGSIENTLAPKLDTLNSKIGDVSTSNTLIERTNELVNRIGDVSTADTLNYMIKDLSENRIGNVSTPDTLNYLIKDLNENRIGDVDTEGTLVWELDTLRTGTLFQLKGGITLETAPSQYGFTMTSDYIFDANGDETISKYDLSGNLVGTVTSSQGDGYDNVKCVAYDRVNDKMWVIREGSGNYKLSRVSDYTQSSWTYDVDYSLSMVDSPVDLTILGNSAYYLNATTITEDGTSYEGTEVIRVDLSDGTEANLGHLGALYIYLSGIENNGVNLLLLSWDLTKAIITTDTELRVISVQPLTETLALLSYNPSDSYYYAKKPEAAGDVSNTLQRLMVQNTLGITMLNNPPNLDVALSVIDDKIGDTALKDAGVTDSIAYILKTGGVKVATLPVTKGDWLSALPNPSNLDVALSTRASESTLSGVKSQTDKLTFDGSNYLYVNVGGDTVGLALDSTLSSFSGRFEPVSASDSVAAGDNTAGLSVQVTADGRPNMELYYNVGGAATINVYGSNDGSTWRPTDSFTTSGAEEDALFYYNAYRYVKVECPTTGIDVTLEVTCSR